MTTVLLEDRFPSTGKPLSVDREKGVISKIKIIGETSANGRRYARKALQEALKKYEGKVVNFDHPAKANDPRRVMDRIGQLINIAEGENGLYGDLHYLTEHPYAKVLAEAAEKMPSLIGMSHNARGNVKRQGDEDVVEEITDVISVDIVADPATTKGLFEATDMNKTTLKKVMESLDKASKERAFLAELLEEDMVPPEAEVPATTDPEQALRDGFKAAMMAAVEAFVAGEVDASGMLSKLKEMAKMLEKAQGSGESSAETPSDEGGDEAAASESKKGKQSDDRLTFLERKDRVRDLCDEAGVKPSKAFLESLIHVSEETAKALIEERKAMPSSKPRSAGVAESRNGTGNDKLPDDPAECRKALFS